MIIWLCVNAYEGELYASTHLTQKGAWLAALGDLLSFLNLDDSVDLDDFRERHGIDPGEELPDHTTRLEALSSEELSKVFHKWNEYTWDNQCGYSIEVMQRQLEG
jgi:hypothetical protein